MTNSQPLVSIKIASYNHAKYISKTIQSVLDQTYSNFELIIVDDCSSDNSVEIIKSFQEERLTLLVNDKNLGAPATSKRAKPLCKGKYFCSLDSDDYFAPDKLEKQVRFMEEHPEADLIVSHVNEVDGDGNCPTEQIHANWFNAEVDLNEPETWIWGNHICHSSVLMKKYVHDELWDYDSGLHFTGDYYNWVRFFVNGVKFHMMPEKLAYYRFHGVNVTHQNPEKSYWEKAFISGRVLHPYLMQIGRQDLVIKNIKTFLFNDAYPSDINARQTLLNILSDVTSLTRKSFSEIWKTREVPEQSLPYNLVIRDLRDDVVNQERYIKEFRRELKENDKVLSERAQLLARVNQQLAERDQQLAERDQQLAERDQQLAERDQQLAERDQQLAERDQQLAERDQQLAERDQQLAERDQQLAELNQHLAYHKKQIEDLLNSYSWRVTAPLRSLGYFARRRVPPAQSTSEKDIVFTPYQVQPLYPSGKNRTKIVHALANFMTGGSSRLVVDLIEHLGHLYEQEVITSYNPSPPNYVGVPIHEFPQLTSPDKIIRFLENFRPKLLHIHYWGECDKVWYEQVFLAAKEYGCKVIENINTPVEPYFAEYIDCYVYVSEYVHKTFGRQDEKSSVIYPGSNFDIFKRAKTKDVPDNCIGMVYRLESDKLYEQSIDVFIKVAQRKQETKILIIGGGTFLEPYKNAVKYAGVQDSFDFTGYVPYEKLPELYEQMSIFVAPVWKESFGQVSSFAMNMGIPVVGYNIGALPEIIANNDLLAPPGDSNKLADIIIDLLNNHEKLKSIGESNRKRVQSLFSVQAMIDSYAKLYEALIEVNK